MFNDHESMETVHSWGNVSTPADAWNHTSAISYFGSHLAPQARDYAARIMRLMEQQDIEANTLASVEDVLAKTDALAAEAIATAVSPLVLECFSVSRQDLQQALLAQSRRHRLFHNRLYLAKRRETLLQDELMYLAAQSQSPRQTGADTPLLRPDEASALSQIQEVLRTSRLRLYREEDALALHQMQRATQLRSQLELGHENFRRLVKHEVGLPAYLGEPLFLRSLEAGIAMDANVALLAAEVQDAETRNLALWTRLLARLQGLPDPEEPSQDPPGLPSGATTSTTSTATTTLSANAPTTPATVPETMYSSALARYKCLAQPASAEEAALSRKAERLYQRSRALAVGDYITILDFLQIWRNTSRAEGRNKLLPLFSPSPHPAVVTTGLLYRSAVRKQLRKLKAEPEPEPGADWRPWSDSAPPHLPQGGAPTTHQDGGTGNGASPGGALFTHLPYPHCLATCLEGLPTARLTPLHPVHARSIWTSESGSNPAVAARQRTHAMHTIFLIWGLALRKNPLGFAARHFSESPATGRGAHARDPPPPGALVALGGRGGPSDSLVARFSTLFAPLADGVAPVFEYPLPYQPLLLPDVCRYAVPATGAVTHIPASMLFPPCTREVLANVQVGIPEFRVILESLMNRHPDLQAFLARELPRTNVLMPPVATTTSATSHNAQPLPHAMHFRSQHARTIFRNRYSTMVSAMLLMALGGLNTGCVSGWALACSCDLLEEPFLRVSVQQVIEGPPFQYNHFWSFVNDFLTAFQNGPPSPPLLASLPLQQKLGTPSQDPSTPHSALSSRSDASDSSLLAADCTGGANAPMVYTPYVWPPPHRVAGLFAPETLALMASQGVDLRAAAPPGSARNASSASRSKPRSGARVTALAQSHPIDRSACEHSPLGRQLALLLAMEDPLPGADDGDALTLEMFLRSGLEQNQFVVNLAILQRIFDGIPRFLKSGVLGRLCFEDLAWLYAAQVDKMDGGLFSVQEQTAGLVRLLRTCDADLAPAEKQLRGALQALHDAQTEQLGSLSLSSVPFSTHPHTPATTPAHSTAPGSSPFPPLVPTPATAPFAPAPGTSLGTGNAIRTLSKPTAFSSASLSQRLQSYLHTPLSRAECDASSIGYWLRCLDMDNDGYVTADDVQLAYEGKAFSILFAKGALSRTEGKLALLIGRGIPYGTIATPSDFTTPTPISIANSALSTSAPNALSTPIESARKLRKEIQLARSCEADLVTQLDEVQNRIKAFQQQMRHNQKGSTGQKDLAAHTRYRAVAAEKTEAELAELQRLAKEHRARLEQQWVALRTANADLFGSDAVDVLATTTSTRTGGNGLGSLRNTFPAGLAQEDTGRRLFRHRGGAALAAEDANSTKQNYDELFRVLQSQVDQEVVLSYYKIKQLLSSISVPNLLLVVGVSHGISILTHSELMTQIIDLLPPKERSMDAKASTLSLDTDLRQCDVLLSKKYIKEAEIGPQIFDLLISKHVGFWES